MFVVSSFAVITVAIMIVGGAGRNNVSGGGHNKKALTFKRVKYVCGLNNICNL